ncbi:MAG: flagellar basal body L-ring protein FlgH [Nitrospiraceae bacterium]|nr:flagellar basal body L-ring protein FlgH [Nitrospiraceae bacterium]
MKDTERTEPGAINGSERIISRNTSGELSPVFALLRFSALCSLLCLLASCATAPQLPPHPAKYIYKEEKGQAASANSLWQDRASLYEDNKAHRLNDIVTINVVENITGSGTANTNTNKTSSLDAKVSSFFGSPLTFPNAFGAGKAFNPNLSSSVKDDFKGTGATTRAGSLIGTLTAKVVEVMPNGNLVLEARKDITINNEKQVLVLRGMIRPMDIAIDNTILSSKVADAEVFYIGDGIVQSKQSPGWLVKLLDKAWPF